MTGPAPLIRIRLIENDASAADSIRAALAAQRDNYFDVVWVRRLSEGLERLAEKGISAVLLALALPDSEGIETFDKLFAAAPDVPILILGGNVPESLVQEAVGRGAQDYLLPRNLDTYSLPRALRHAIDRKAVEDALYLERERALVTLNSIGDAVLCPTFPAPSPI
jgi:DNA-binding NarL/FixJ family response regulator